MSLKLYLDEMAARYNVPAFVTNDPVQFPRRFSQPSDIEIAALLTAVVAWGGRKQIIASCEKMFTLMEWQPTRYIAEEEWRNIPLQMNIHRTFFGRDFCYFCRAMKFLYREKGSMEALFAGETTVWNGIEALRRFFWNANGEEYSKHLSNPGCDNTGGSACKRLHLMLRWLCRPCGPVDMGLWDRVSPSQLMIPLDVHVARTARLLGLLTRRENDRLAVEELTAQLKQMSPEDPVKYDFALFGAGVAEERKREQTAHSGSSSCYDDYVKK